MDDGQVHYLHPFMGTMTRPQISVHPERARYSVRTGKQGAENCAEWSTRNWPIPTTSSQRIGGGNRTRGREGRWLPHGTRDRGTERAWDWRDKKGNSHDGRNVKWGRIVKKEQGDNANKWDRIFKRGAEAVSEEVA